MSHRRTCRVIFLVAGCLLVSAPISANQQLGQLTGQVADQTGAALPGVLVTASRDERSLETVTGSAGEYQFENLSPGRYHVRFTLIGFAEHERTIDVAAATPTHLDARLHISLTTEVTVTGRNTFRHLAEFERPESNLVGLANAASEGAVTARQLERRPVQRAGELVETVPGLSVTQHSGEGKATQYYLRGFNLDHGTDFSTTIAGVPVNLPTHAHGHGYTDTNFLIPELVTGIQYFKGPYTAEAGDFSSAGGVNINYASVLDAPLVRASIGGHGWARVLAAASPRVGRGHLLAAAETAQSEGPWVRPDNYRRDNVVLRYSHGDTLNNVAVTGLAYRASWNASDQAPRRALDAGTLPRFGSIDTTTGGDTGRYAASFEWQRASAATRNRFTGYAVAYDLDLFSNFTYFLDDPVNGDQFHQADRRLISGLRLSHARLGRFAGRPLEYHLGAQMRRDDIGRIGLYRTHGRQRLSTVREDSVAQFSTGLWTDADIRWSSWLRSTTGVRVDGYRFHVIANVPENSGRDTAALVSPKGSVVLGPWRGTELYVNGGYGFHSNDARGAAIRIEPVDRSPAERVTPLARTRGAEIGARTVAIPGVQSTVALWHLALDSELVFVGDAGTTSASRPTGRYGVEWSTFAQPLPWLSVDADLAWSRARFTDDDPAGSHVPGAVEKTASLGVTADGGNRVVTSLRWRYFGSRPLVEDNAVRSRPTSLVNGQLGYRLSNRLSAIVDIFNVLDARVSDVDYFYRSRLPSEPIDGIDDVHTHPALPRTMRLTLALGF